MFKHFSATLACLSALLPPVAAADPVPLPFEPKAGAEWRVVETRTLTTNQPGRPPRQQGTVEARLKVIEKTGDGYLMEWKTESVSTQGVRLSADDGYADLLIGVSISFEADSEAFPVRLRNSAALIDTAVSAAARLAPSADPRTQAALRQLFGTTDPATLAQLLLPQASLIGNCHNFQLEPGEMLESEAMSPNIAGGAPIRSFHTVTMKDAGSESKPAHIVIAERYDPEAATAAVFEMMTRLARDNGLPPPKPADKLRPIERNSTIECFVNRQTGETARVYMDMIVESDSQRRQDIRDITLSRLQ